MRVEAKKKCEGEMDRRRRKGDIKQRNKEMKEKGEVGSNGRGDSECSHTAA